MSQVSMIVFSIDKMVKTIVKIVKIIKNCWNLQNCQKSSSHWSNVTLITSLQGRSLYAKSKSPWFLAVICRFLARISRFLAVICGSLSVSVGSWRLYVGSWRSSAVPGGYLVLGVLLSCSGQLKIYRKSAKIATTNFRDKSA